MIKRCTENSWRLMSMYRYQQNYWIFTKNYISCIKCLSTHFIAWPPTVFISGDTYTGVECANKYASDSKRYYYHDVLWRLSNVDESNNTIIGLGGLFYHAHMSYTFHGENRKTISAIRRTRHVPRQSHACDTLDLVKFSGRSSRVFNAINH